MSQKSQKRQRLSKRTGKLLIKHWYIKEEGLTPHDAEVQAENFFSLSRGTFSLYPNLAIFTQWDLCILLEDIDSPHNEEQNDE